MAKRYVTSVSGHVYLKRDIRNAKRDYRRAVRLERKQNREKFRNLVGSDNVSSVSASSIFGVVFLMLFIINFFYSSMGSNNSFSFTGLLYAFQNAPKIPTDWLRTFSNMSITSDWGTLFNWFRDFLNDYVMKLVSVTLFLCTGIAQLFMFAVYFIGILFGG